MVVFTCPSCGFSKQVKDEFAGKAAKCPRCQEVVRLPAAEPEFIDMPSPERSNPSKRLLGIGVGVLAVMAIGGLVWAITRDRQRQPSEAKSDPPPVKEKPAIPKTEVRGEITGGAWVNKGSTTDPVRGLVVTLVRSTTTVGNCRPALETAKKNTQAVVELIKTDQEGLIYGSDPALRTEVTSKAEERIRSIERLLEKADREQVNLPAVYREIRGVDEVWGGMERVNRNADLRGIQRLIRYKTMLNDGFHEAIQKTAATAAHTGIDGKYRLADVPQGEYILYALHATDDGITEWLLPVLVLDSTPVNQDLFTGNAIYSLAKPGR